MDILCVIQEVGPIPVKKRLFSWHRWVKLRERKHKRRKPGEQHWVPRPGSLENPVFQSWHRGWELLIATTTELSLALPIPAPGLSRRPAPEPVPLRASNIPLEWRAGQKDPMSHCADQLLPWLCQQAGTHAHACTRQHTHVPSPLTRGGENEKEGGAARQLLSVPCCYLRSCMLLSWAMFSLLL